MRRMRDREIETARRYAYRVTDSDVEAAGMLGMSPAAFRAWRRLRGLPAKRPRGRPMIEPGRLQDRRRQ